MPRDKRRQDAILVRTLARGEPEAWATFVKQFAPAIFGSIMNTLRRSGYNSDDSTDIAQDVFLRLCKNDYRLLKTFDEGRAGLRTWLGVVASSATIDHLRRQKGANLPLDSLPEDVGAVQPVMRDPVNIPDGLLSARQALVLRLLYDADMDAAEVGVLLRIDSQTVRSTHHKALVKLRKYFAETEE